MAYTLSTAYKSFHVYFYQAIFGLAKKDSGFLSAARRDQDKIFIIKIFLVDCSVGNVGQIVSCLDRDSCIRL